MTISDRRIVLGVTSDQSLSLMRGLPERLIAEGWDVHVVASPGTRSRALAGVGGLTFHPLPMERDPNLVADLRSLFAWWKVLRSTRPDVLFAGTPKAGLLSMLAGRALRVPVRVYNLRGLRLETISGPKRHIFRAVERLTFGAATSAVAVSPSLMRRTIELGLCHPRKLRVLGHGSSNGVDTARFAPGVGTDAPPLGAHDMDPTIPVIGFVGRLTRDKGLSELLDASIDLVAKGVPHQILLVGPVEDADTRTSLEALAARGVTVTQIGMVQDTSPYYRIMTVLCLPSHREGFPNVVLEAASSGVAAVTTDATGAVDSVVDGVTGFIVPVGDSVKLSNALERLLRDRPLRLAFEANARKRAIDSFERSDVQRLVLDYLSAEWSLARRGRSSI